ncbi:hypothetical protein ACFQLX_13370 [Streptomyces polyrhachis]|uniref:Uncharacterized protein n=1 Tax=Streptomyces polyrhachis TaxID=1282885 RepID=A0ABW2GEL3_9ACTN
MAAHFADAIPDRLLMWQRVREYAVPPSMIEIAAARRAGGDWAGACAAARVDVDLDLCGVRDRYGTEMSRCLRADLRSLAPDLLRWHLPRVAPDGRLRPGLTIPLVDYGSWGPVLVVRTPPARADAGQRISLALWEGVRGDASGRHSHPHPHPDRRFRLDLHRHLWDAGRSGELARRCGAGWGTDSPWAVGRWAAEAELLLRSEGRSRGAFVVRMGARGRGVFELVAPDDSHVPVLRPLRGTLSAGEVRALPVLPEMAARTLPDLELLRAGLVAVERLHPLVAAALGAWGGVADSDVGPVVVADSGSGDPHRVECRGESHRIALRDGVLTAVDHDADQLRREELLVALGGPPLPCLRAIDAVHRDPQALPAVRERLGHGDIAGALAVVEGLLGPGAVLREGPLRAELESAAARRIEHGLFRSGLVDVHPGAVAGASGTGRRRRLDRRTPRELRRRWAARSRPRTALAD